MVRFLGKYALWIVTLLALVSIHTHRHFPTALTMFIGSSFLQTIDLDSSKLVDG
jgi:hypothetical protein